MFRGSVAAIVTCSLALFGCSTADAPAHDTTPSTQVAEEQGAAPIYRSKCGACHTPVEPGSHSKSELETAFRRHRRRVALTEVQWSALVEYLAAH